jgi:glycosyltransferase involved in cell wall biosynthesis
MRVFISYDLTDSPWGGGNQFLKNLKKYLIEEGLYCESPENADIILYNGHQFIEETLLIKKRYPNKTFVHRMDGLQKLYNDSSDTRQDLAINFNKLSNATIFQSQWAKDEFNKFNFNPEKSTVILNAADPEIFYNTEETRTNAKINLLCTSFSNNLNKGFLFYKELDDILDFQQFNFTFIGNKPDDITYKNIKCLPPKTTIEIAERLKQTDVFVSATVNDCCSNSIIEALTSGVPVLAQNSGGNPELVGRGGELFENIDEFVFNLQKITLNIDFYKKFINIKTMKQIASDYVEFFKCI